MIVEKKIVESNGSLYVPIPKNFAEWLEWDSTQIVKIEDKENKGMKRITIWGKQNQEQEK